MTSISSSTLLQAYQSPRDRLQTTLESQIASGTIEQSDATALSTALDDIDSALTSARQSGATSGSQPPSPDEMQAKIEDLIAAEVDSGTLTSDQATELANVFAEAFANGPGGGGEGPGGPGGGKGPGGPGGPGGPKGPPPGGAEGASGTEDTESTDDDVAQLIQNFLKALQETQSSKSPKSYGASGDSKSTTSSAALVLDFQS